MKAYTARQQEIHSRLYDKLQTFRFTRVTDKAQAAKIMQEIVVEIDNVVDEQIKKKGTS